MDAEGGPASLLPLREGGLGWARAERRVSRSSLRSVLRGLLPSGARRWRFVFGALLPSERRALVGAALRSRFGGASDWRPVLRRARTVSFICHGNLIRSPFAAAAFAQLVRERGYRIDVVSAGVAARSGEPADPRASQSASEQGLSLAAHRATMLDAQHVQSADVLVVMDRLNLARILARHPEAEGRVLLLAGCHADGRLTLDEIHDPVAGTLDDVRKSHAEVLAGVHRLADALGTSGA
jgi:protein-tyrosine phosphatase